MVAHRPFWWAILTELDAHSIRGKQIEENNLELVQEQAEPGTDGFIDDEFKNYLIFDGASRGARETLAAFLHTPFIYSYCVRIG